MSVDLCCDVFYGIRINREEAWEFAKKYLDENSDPSDEREKMDLIHLGFEKSPVGEYFEGFEDNTDYLYIGVFHELTLGEYKDLDDLRARLMKKHQAKFTEEMKKEHSELFQRNMEEFLVIFHPQ